MPMDLGDYSDGMPATIPVGMSGSARLAQAEPSPPGTHAPAALSHRTTPGCQSTLHRARGGPLWGDGGGEGEEAQLCRIRGFP
jgi:hypothetical protein